MDRPADITSPGIAVRTMGAFRWNGFVGQDLMQRLRTRCSELLAGDDVEKQSRSLRVWNLFSYGPEFCELLLDDRLRQACTDLLGTGYLLSDYSLNAVYPGGQQDPWHVDYPYSESHEPVSSSAPLGLQCVIAVDAFDEHNGATEFLARSHDAAQPTGPGPDRTAWRRRFDGHPGDLLIMHAATWHRAGLNRSTSLRTGIVLSFVQRWVRPIIAPRDVLGSITSTSPEELRVLLGTVVYEEIDSDLVRREVL